MAKVEQEQFFRELEEREKEGTDCLFTSGKFEDTKFPIVYV